MKNESILIAVLIWFLVFTAATLRGSDPDVKDMIIRADSVIMNPETPRESLKGALVEILDAALLILPKTAANAECRSRRGGRPLSPRLHPDDHHPRPGIGAPAYVSATGPIG
jgi:hypothetical protein